MSFQLLPLKEEEVQNFKAEMQDAFFKAAEAGIGAAEEVLPEADIDQSLNAEGAHAYKAVLDGETVGGTVVVIDEESQNHHLDFLYVRHGIQGQGIGQLIWQELERLYPFAETWETHTPYFDKRNIHFYINRLGFQAVEFYNDYHPDPQAPRDADEFDGMFRFVKNMKKS